MIGLPALSPAPLQTTSPGEPRPLGLVMEFGSKSIFDSLVGNSSPCVLWECSAVCPALRRTKRMPKIAEDGAEVRRVEGESCQCFVQSLF